MAMADSNTAALNQFMYDLDCAEQRASMDLADMQDKARGKLRQVKAMAAFLYQ